MPHGGGGEDGEFNLLSLWTGSPVKHWRDDGEISGDIREHYDLQNFRQRFDAHARSLLCVREWIRSGFIGQDTRTCWCIHHSLSLSISGQLLLPNCPFWKAGTPISICFSSIEIYLSSLFKSVCDACGVYISSSTYRPISHHTLSAAFMLMPCLEGPDLHTWEGAM